VSSFETEWCRGWRSFEHSDREGLIYWKIVSGNLDHKDTTSAVVDQEEARAMSLETGGRGSLLGNSKKPSKIEVMWTTK
jgi:hypothetical protein